MSLYIPEVKIPQDKQSILMWLSSDGTVAYYVGTYPKLGGEVKAIEIPDHGNLIDREAFRRDVDNHYPFDTTEAKSRKWYWLHDVGTCD